MIYDIGVDICKIDRVEDLISSERRLARLFTEGEIAYIKSKNNAIKDSAAAIFAAKEAVFKALGFGIGKISFLDVDIRHDDRGKPYISFLGEGEKVIEQMGIKASHLSISHDANVAIAMVVLEV